MRKTKWSFPGLEKCEFPNLAAEIHMHNAGHPDTYASHANITPTVLKCYLQGEGELTVSEFAGIAGLSISLTNVPCSVKYLTCKKTSYYDLSIPKHYRKLIIAYSAFDEAKTNYTGNFWLHGARRIPPFEEIISERVITRAFLNNILHLTERMSREKETVVRSKLIIEDEKESAA